MEHGQQVDPQAFVEYVTQANNLAEDLSETKLTEIASDALAGYKLDKDSMSDWLDEMRKGIELAELVKEEKRYPFERASNVKYPLVTSAALQFNARAYPAIVPSDQAVKAKVYGSDPEGKKAARGERIAGHMSWQLTNQIEEWEEDTDKLLVQLPIVGTICRKWWMDPVSGRARVRTINPAKFIVNDYVTVLADAPRLTEELPLYPTEIKTRILSGQFVEFEYTNDDEDEEAPQEFIEQHCLVDLDDDEYPEPYIVTIHVDSQKVVRMVADFEPQDVTLGAVAVDETYEGEVDQPQGGIVHIRRGSYFVAHHFMPSMSGGFHGIGLGILLGDISNSINTIINMLIDAGHYASLGGGFIGSDFRMKGGAQRHRPGEWKMVAATGDDIRKSIVPMTFPGPDGTLFQMLGLLIDAGREIASVKDVMTGDSGKQVQTATTTLALIEQGMMVFTAAYKRIFRSMKAEFKLLAKMNAQYTSPDEYNAFHDEDQQYDPAQDYGAQDMDVVPVADPRSVTKMQEAAKSQLLMQMANDGLVDKGEAAARVIEAMSIGDIEKLAPQPDPAAARMAELQVSAAEAELIKMRAEIELTLAKVDSEEAKAMKDETDAEATAGQVRLDEIRVMLEAERDRLQATLSGGAGGMAGKPGNTGAPGGAGANVAPPAGPMPSELLGGQPMAGPGPGVTGPIGGMGG